MGTNATFMISCYKWSHGIFTAEFSGNVNNANSWHIFKSSDGFPSLRPRDLRWLLVPHPFAAIGPVRWCWGEEMAADSLSRVVARPSSRPAVDQYHSVSRCCSIVKMAASPGRIFTGMSRMGELWPIAARRPSNPPQYSTEGQGPAMAGSEL